MSPSPLISPLMMVRERELGLISFDSKMLDRFTLNRDLTGLIRT